MNNNKNKNKSEILGTSYNARISGLKKQLSILNNHMWKAGKY